jgi:hypothetical protein
MQDPLQPFRLLARGAGDAARSTLRHGALVGFALIIAALGLGFVSLAAYVGLRFLIGPGFAALTIGLALLATAGALLVLSHRKRPELPSPPPFGSGLDDAAKATQAPAEAAAMAVFTAAFVVGRTLADHYGPARNS